MSPEEWNGVVAVMTANWPHQLPPDEALQKWGHDLAEEKSVDVLLAVETLYRDGREFPPNGAHILARIGELSRNDPDPGQAWAIVNRVGRKCSFYYEPTGAMELLKRESTAIAEAVRRFGLEALALRDIKDEAIHRAQFRKVYEGVLEDRRRNQVRRGLEGSIRRLQGPQRPDYMGSLVLGGGEETSW
jgi:hypothetical protein